MPNFFPLPETLRNPQSLVLGRELPQPHERKYAITRATGPNMPTDFSKGFLTSTGPSVTANTQAPLNALVAADAPSGKTAVPATLNALLDQEIKDLDAPSGKKLSGFGNVSLPSDTARRNAALKYGMWGPNKQVETSILQSMLQNVLTFPGYSYNAAIDALANLGGIESIVHTTYLQRLLTDISGDNSSRAGTLDASFGEVPNVVPTELVNTLKKCSPAAEGEDLVETLVQSLAASTSVTVPEPTATPKAIGTPISADIMSLRETFLDRSAVKRLDAGEQEILRTWLLEQAVNTSMKEERTQNEGNRVFLELGEALKSGAAVSGAFEQYITKAIQKADRYFVRREEHREVRREISKQRHTIQMISTKLLQRNLADGLSTSGENRDIDAVIHSKLALAGMDTEETGEDGEFTDKALDAQKYIKESATEEGLKNEIRRVSQEISTKKQQTRELEEQVQKAFENVRSSRMAIAAQHAEKIGKMKEKEVNAWLASDSSKSKVNTPEVNTWIDLCIKLHPALENELLSSTAYIQLSTTAGADASTPADVKLAAQKELERIDKSRHAYYQSQFSNISTYLYLLFALATSLALSTPILARLFSSRSRNALTEWIMMKGLYQTCSLWVVAMLACGAAAGSIPVFKILFAKRAERADANIRVYLWGDTESKTVEGVAAILMKEFEQSPENAVEMREMNLTGSDIMLLTSEEALDASKQLFTNTVAPYIFDAYLYPKETSEAFETDLASTLTRVRREAATATAAAAVPHPPPLSDSDINILTPMELAVLPSVLNYIIVSILCRERQVERTQKRAAAIPYVHIVDEPAYSQFYDVEANAFPDRLPYFEAFLNEDGDESKPEPGYITSGVKQVLKRARAVENVQLLSVWLNGVLQMKKVGAQRPQSEPFSDNTITREELGDRLRYARAEEEVTAEFSAWRSAASSADANAVRILESQLDSWRLTLLADTAGNDYTPRDLKGLDEWVERKRAEQEAEKAREAETKASTSEFSGTHPAANKGSATSATAGLPRAFTADSGRIAHLYGSPAGGTAFHPELKFKTDILEDTVQAFARLVV